MKVPISQVLLQTSLLIVQFSKTYLKTLSWTFFMNGRICCFSLISFKCSINYFLEYRHMTKLIAARLLTNFTFELQRISKWKFLIIFSYTEVLFPRHYLEEAVQSFQKTFCRNFQKTISRKTNVVAPNLSKISGRKCL